MEIVMRHRLCSENDVPESGSIIVPFFGREVHVYRSGGRIRVVANVCLHFGGPLECKGEALVCPWHGASYDMDSGLATEGPARKDARLMFLSSRIENGDVNYVWGE
jgi:nitrite reductase/ring-hydroxylating ferredoxin subunit